MSISFTLRSSVSPLISILNYTVNFEFHYSFEFSIYRCPLKFVGTDPLRFRKYVNIIVLKFSRKYDFKRSLNIGLTFPFHVRFYNFVSIPTFVYVYIPIVTFLCKPKINVNFKFQLYSEYLIFTVKFLVMFDMKVLFNSDVQVVVRVRFKAPFQPHF